MKNLIVKFRASTYFLYLIVLFCITWMVTRLTLHWFDPELGLYNSILSTEASIMISVLLEMQLFQDAKIREILEHIKMQNANIFAQNNVLIELLNQVRVNQTEEFDELEEKLDEITGKATE